MNFYVEIFSIKTDEVIETFGPMPENQAELVASGVNRNLEIKEYFARITQSDKEDGN